MAEVITNLYDRLDDAWRYESDYGSYADDIPLILELARESGDSVLEIGAGTGRVAIRLARAGFEVMALEKSIGMLNLFEKKLSSEKDSVRLLVTLAHGEPISSRFDRKFNFIVLSFNFLQLAPTRSDRLAILNACYDALSTDGRVYAEVSMPHPDFITAGYSDNKYIKTFFDRGKMQWAVLFQAHDYNSARQELNLKYTYRYLNNDGSTETITRSASLSVIFPLELEGLFEEVGFRVNDVWGGFKREPLSPDCTRIVVVASKK